MKREKGQIKTTQGEPTLHVLVAVGACGAKEKKFQKNVDFSLFLKKSWCNTIFIFAQFPPPPIFEAAVDIRGNELEKYWKKFLFLKTFRKMMV